MALEIWLAYALAATVVSIIPGPTILLVITQSVAHGRSAALPLVAGVVLGDTVAVALSLLGLGALLAASAVWFAVVKWLGAVYLIYLGVRFWCDSGKGIAPTATAAATAAAATAAARSLFGQAFLVTTFNPKSIVFFIAFLPQFVTPSAADVPAQLLILAATFVVIGGLNAMGYAVFAGALKRFLQAENVRRRFNRCGGTALIGAGVFAATAQRV